MVDETRPEDADGKVMIECLVGPYRGQRLKVTAAQGDIAIKDQWARVPKHPPIDHDEPAPADYTPRKWRRRLRRPILPRRCAQRA